MSCNKHHLETEREELIIESRQQTQQFEEWNAIFETMSECKKLNFSELEIHAVLSNRFEIEIRK